MIHLAVLDRIDEATALGDDARVEAYDDADRLCYCRVGGKTWGGAVPRPQCREPLFEFGGRGVRAAGLGEPGAAANGLNGILVLEMHSRGCR